MANKTLIFSFLLLFAVSLVSAVDVNHIFPNIDLNSVGYQKLYLSDYYSNFNKVNFSYSINNSQVDVESDVCGIITANYSGLFYFESSCDDPFDESTAYLIFEGQGGNFSIFPFAITLKDNTSEITSYISVIDGGSIFPTYTPSFKLNIPTQDLGYGGALAFNLNDYVINYDYFVLEWHDDILDTDFEMTTHFNSDEVCNGEDGDIIVCTEGLNTDMQLSFYSNRLDKNKTITITAYNTFGNVFSSFLVKSSSDADYEYDTNYHTPDNNGASFIGGISDDFGELFPHESMLSSRAKYAYVFISLLFITLLIYFLAWKVAGISNIIHYVVGLVNFVLFCFFISIGYIPVMLLIMFFLVIIALVFFRLKGGGG